MSLPLIPAVPAPVRRHFSKAKTTHERATVAPSGGKFLPVNFLQQEIGTTHQQPLWISNHIPQVNLLASVTSGFCILNSWILYLTWRRHLLSSFFREKKENKRECEYKMLTKSEERIPRQRENETNEKMEPRREVIFRWGENMVCALVTTEFIVA